VTIVDYMYSCDVTFMSLSDCAAIIIFSVFALHFALTDVSVPF